MHFINPDVFGTHGQDILLSAKQVTFAFLAFEEFKI